MLTRHFYLTFLVLLATLHFALAQTQYGVWANRDSEVLSTGSHCLFFERIDNLFVVKYFNLVRGEEMHRCRAYGEVHFRDTSVVYMHLDYQSDSLIHPSSVGEFADSVLLIKGMHETQVLHPVERISLVQPYEMEYAHKDNLGKCLQEWMLGVRLELKEADNLFRFGAGTNNHSFMFHIQNGFVYCRAARIKSTNGGTLFAQNIRLYNDGMYREASMTSHNYQQAVEKLVVDSSLFNPHACVYDSVGFYWSVLRYDNTCIVLNGCNEEYFFYRQGIENSGLVEWFGVGE